MAKILAFAGSNSSTSINYKLVGHTVSLLDEHDVQRLDMVNYPFVMYSADFEKKHGYSNSLVELKNTIHEADGLIISVNEHNGGLSAYFKNVIDWLSRLETKFLSNKKIFLMATSPGKRGGQSALKRAEEILPIFGASIVSTFSLPSFNHNFDAQLGITDSELSDQYQRALKAFLNQL